MLEEKEVYLIPRNLNKPDVLIHKPITLDWKETLYIAAGIGGMVWTYQTGLPPIGKLIGLIASSLVAILGASFRHEGLMIHELIIDVLTYLQRKIYYRKERGDGNATET